MAHNRKEARKINISVEGDVCEKLYFEHLAKLINTSEENKYNVKINCKKASPIEFAKRNAYLPTDKWHNRIIPYFHIQDIEDYRNRDQCTKFRNMIDIMRDTEAAYGINYELGYSNYSFELWMILHTEETQFRVADRFKYIQPISRCFNKRYISLDEFKEEKEFSRILSTYISLDSVKNAIRRADAIVRENEQDKRQKENYKGVVFYKESPDLSVHEVVKQIFSICGIDL